MTDYQTAKERHRAQENIFVPEILMKLNKNCKEPLILQFMELWELFDKEVLRDVLNAAHSNNPKGKDYRILHKLNKKSL